ncbi:uncharacterized protein LOC132518327 [Lagenorhynchus albirostris]|uniref:uncharacterized protein LOC132518327 n=1 Tax=Lagenorhynchus albirostris TaxID=27610 RepID=UPI0028ED79BB|nr:uncharacterized protein LOC132518327 [Lagenorhynchus albirostris]
MPPSAHARSPGSSVLRANGFVAAKAQQPGAQQRRGRVAKPQPNDPCRARLACDAGMLTVEFVLSEESRRAASPRPAGFPGRSAPSGPAGEGVWRAEDGPARASTSLAARTPGGRCTRAAPQQLLYDKHGPTKLPPSQDESKGLNCLFTQHLSQKTEAQAMVSTTDGQPERAWRSPAGGLELDRRRNIIEHIPFVSSLSFIGPGLMALLHGGHGRTSWTCHFRLSSESPDWKLWS